MNEGDVMNLQTNPYDLIRDYRDAIRLKAKWGVEVDHILSNTVELMKWHYTEEQEPKTKHDLSMFLEEMGVDENDCTKSKSDLFPNYTRVDKYVSCYGRSYMYRTYVDKDGNYGLWTEVYLGEKHLFTMNEGSDGLEVLDLICIWRQGRIYQAELQEMENKSHAADGAGEGDA